MLDSMRDSLALLSYGYVNSPKWITYPVIVYTAITWAIPVLSIEIGVWETVKLWVKWYLIPGTIIWMVVLPIVGFINKTVKGFRQCKSLAKHRTNTTAPF